MFLTNCFQSLLYYKEAPEITSDYFRTDRIMKYDQMIPNDRYQSYLLRLWQESPETPWRAMLKCSVSGEELVFADLDKMLAFLRAQMEEMEIVQTE